MMLGNAVLKDLLSKMVPPAAQREAVAQLQACHGMGERRACRVATVDRTNMHYR